MLMSEFIERTGFQPMADEYGRIEEDYYSFDGDQEAFCKSFVESGGEGKFNKARAAEIERLRNHILELEKQFKKEMADRDSRIDQLTTELDKELEWKPCTSAGTNMFQEQYEHLSQSGRVMTDQEAREYLADECGFAEEKIVILHTASSFEVNKYQRLRKATEFDRDPLYESTDWNYIRFNCAHFMYELINGELFFYSC